MSERTEKIVILLLRVGVAFAFIYPAVSAFFNPLAWIGFFPLFMRDLIPNDTLLLSLFGITEIIIALWILIGRKIFIPSVLAAIYLFFIVVLNFSLLDITFRDIPIFLMAVALAVWSWEKRSTPPPPAEPTQT